MTQNPSHPKSGFSLVEVMIALAIFSTVMAMSMSFLVESSKINFTSKAKNNINRELRNVVDRMATEAKQSNFFILYTSADNLHRIDHEDRLRPNESGDALLLVEKSAYAEMAEHGVDPLYDPRPIIRLILYYRIVTAEENGAQIGPVMRWERDFSQYPIVDSNQIRNVEELIPPLNQLVAESRQVVAFSEGLSDGRLFFNYLNRTAMINGKILHGNKAKWVSDTYNFSISPRG